MSAFFYDENGVPIKETYPLLPFKGEATVSIAAGATGEES